MRFSMAVVVAEAAVEREPLAQREQSVPLERLGSRALKVVGLVP
jgi:hypothetical protein